MIVFELGTGKQALSLLLLIVLKLGIEGRAHQRSFAGELQRDSTGISLRDCTRDAA